MNLTRQLGLLHTVRRCTSYSRLAILSASALAAVRGAYADTFSFNATANGTIQNTGPRTGANGVNFLNLESDGNGSFASYGVLDFGQINIGNSTVNSINSISLDMYDAPASFSATNPVSVNFYFSTSTASLSSLKYVLGGNPQGGFGTSLGSTELLGTGSYVSSGSNGSLFHYTLSTNGLSAAANSYLLTQLNSFGTIRVVAGFPVSSGTASTVTATYTGLGTNFVTPGGGTSAAPHLNFDLNVTTLPSNDSNLLFVGAADTSTVNIDLGRVIRNANSGTAAVAVANTGTSPANPLLLNHNQTFGTLAAPLAAGGSATLAAGLSAAATNLFGGSTASGVMNVHNIANSNTADLTVNFTGTVVENRLLRNTELVSSTNANSVGRILVGATVTNQVTVSTQNLNTTGTNVLTHLQLAATASANFPSSATSPYVLNGTNTSGFVDFTDNQTATFKLTLRATKSGQSLFGSNAAFLRFTNTNGLIGEGLANESDGISLYNEYTAYAPAVLTGTSVVTTPLTGSLLLSNAGADNGTNSFRLGGKITASSVLAQGGFTVGGGLGTSVIIPISSTATASYSFSSPGKLNGTYAGKLTYSAENDDQTVVGTAPGDVATNKTIAFAATVSGNSGSGTANLLPGGSYAGYFINRGSGSNTTVSFLGGTSAAGADPTVNFATSSSLRAAGDVGVITGTGTDKYVVQYSFGTALTTSAISVGRFTGSNYTAAGYGNSASALGTEVKGAFDNNFTLGRSGIDMTNHVVWAVVDRPGTFVAYARAAGDVNFDGQINNNDIRSLATSGFYNDGLTTHTFVEGDFNGDGAFNNTDVRAIATGGLYNTGAYDPVIAAAPAHGPVTLASQNTVAAAGGALIYNYDPSTGDVTVTLNGNTNVVEVDLLSTGNKFLTAGSKLAADGMTFITNSAHEQDGFSSFGSFITDGTDLGNILPTNLTLSQLTADLTLLYSVQGNGNQLTATLAVPEPTTLTLFALGAMGLMARRKRR